MQSLLAVGTLAIPSTPCFVANVKHSVRGALQPGHSFSTHCQAHLCLVILGPRSCWSCLGSDAPETQITAQGALGWEFRAGTSWSRHASRCCHSFVTDGFLNVLLLARWLLQECMPFMEELHHYLEVHDMKKFYYFEKSSSSQQISRSHLSTEELLDSLGKLLSVLKI